MGAVASTDDNLGLADSREEIYPSANKRGGETREYSVIIK